jgi:DNA-binding transcriptional LysR family regulator
MLFIEIMLDLNIDRLNLNLLVALDALIAERSVTRAAARLGLSQPAVSHALARLRKALGDPLLVRSPRGMDLTPRAQAIAGPLTRALGDLAAAVRPPAFFDPARTARRFRIATDDYLERLLLPKLLPRLWQEAPGIDIEVTTSGARSGHDLADGLVDAVIAPAGVIGPLPGAYTQHLFEERFVCLSRQDHPAIGRRLTLDAYVAVPHILVSPGGRPGSIVDKALSKLGRRRRVAVNVPHFLAALPIVRQSDVVITIGSRLAFASREGLRIHKPPLDLPGFSVSLFWHEREHADPAHVWFRRIVASVAKAM